MNPENIQKASKLLKKLLIGSLIIVGIATGLYYWKGLENLTTPENGGAYYYQAN